MYCSASSPHFSPLPDLCQPDLDPLHNCPCTFGKFLTWIDLEWGSRSGFVGCTILISKRSHVGAYSATVEVSHNPSACPVILGNKYSPWYQDSLGFACA